jgi:hypothetical protein
MAFKFKLPKLPVKQENLIPEITWSDVLLELDLSDVLIQQVINSVLELKDAYVRVPEKLNKLAPTPINITEGKATISNWSNVLQSFDGGDCVDITQTLLKIWQEDGILDELEKADVLVEFVEGTEPKFFNSDEDNHAFLVLSNTVNKVVVDPSLQVIASKDSSGYSGRTKKSVDAVLILKRKGERVLSVANVSDIDAMETAVVGLTSNRDCAISLGFVDGRVTTTPLLKLSKGTNRYYISFENERETGTDDVKFNGISEESLNEISRIIRIVKEYIFKTTVTLDDIETEQVLKPVEIKVNVKKSTPKVKEVVEKDIEDVYDESIYEDKETVST